LKRDVEQGGAHPKNVKEELAVEIVGRYHGRAAAEEARQGFNAVFARGAVPDDAPSHVCAAGETSRPVAFLTDSGLTASRGEARRLIHQNALSVDGNVLTEAETSLPAGDYDVRLGKKRFLRLRVR
jgi:tyrosyl-tRNA synthetase